MLRSRFGVLVPFAAGFLGISLLTRVVLLVKSWPVLEFSARDYLKVFAGGCFFDLLTLTYMAVPVIAYLIIFPDKIFRRKWHRPVLYSVLFFFFYLWIFDIFAEYYFFEEFGTRFNFIAVDYLVYTNTILKDIWQSYPVIPILAVTAAVSLFAVWCGKKTMDRSLRSASTIRSRLRVGAMFIALPLISYAGVDSSWARFSDDNYVNELGNNGMYNLFAAFLHNRIDYPVFYPVIPDEEAWQGLKSALKEEKTRFTGERMFDVEREIRNPGPEKRLNVILIVEESLSAEYLGVFGNRENLTPNLDRLARESLFFTNFYATGTRTDRGLEAITLSIPPTPGRSAIKRPHNENMFSWGSLMREKGYATEFLYSGYGYFDNMNYFFSHNGFEAVDRLKFKKEEIHFENAWGVCDEDLFDKALGEFDMIHERRRPFFALIMTTSNHRPFTYPDGRVPLPSRSGRHGGVQYADYALGRFLEAARQKPWFSDSIFVVVADHCADSAGHMVLPVHHYHIPLFIYAPGRFAPREIDVLSSQIDVAPTVLGLLNFSYTTRFFGRDIRSTPPGQGRAFIGTYQKLGYLKGNRLTLLDVKRERAAYEFKREGQEQKPVSIDPGLLNEGISYYQGAYYSLERTQPLLHRRDPGRKG